MRHVLPLLLFLAVGAGCGSESPDTPAPGTEWGEDADERDRTGGLEVSAGSLSVDAASPAADRGPRLEGRAEAVARAKALRRGTTLASLQADARVQAVLSAEDLDLLERADSVRLIVGDPLLALSEDELAAGKSAEQLAAELEEAVSPSAPIDDAADRGELAFRLLRAIAGSDGRGARCFEPQHTLRFCRGSRCMEVSICLGCGRLAVCSCDALEVRHGTLDRSLRSTLLGLCRKYGLGAGGGC